MKTITREQFVQLCDIRQRAAATHKKLDQMRREVETILAGSGSETLGPNLIVDSQISISGVLVMLEITVEPGPIWLGETKEGSLCS